MGILWGLNYSLTREYMYAYIFVQSVWHNHGSQM